jgi:peptidyl-prolyl cis-trans isomerase A (cyclophilin A)
VPDDSANADSATSQFLINVTDNPSLDSLNGGYTVFARIIGTGMVLIDQMAAFPIVAFDDNGLSRIPVIGQEVPIQNSPRVNIFDATIFDGDIDDFEGDGSGDGGDGGDGGTDGGDGGDGETPIPGEGETLYEDAVCVDTTVGEFCMALLSSVAPATVANFLNYINDGDYDNTLIHRSVPDFVIQGGGYYSDSNPLGAEVPKDAAIVNEFNRSNLRGTVAMAKLGGQVNSATSEWFVNLSDNTGLDSGDGIGGGFFTVFAEIITGMSVVDDIGNLPRINLGGAFDEIPRSRTIGSAGVVAEDLVLVHRIYVTDVVADDSDNGSGGDGGDGGDGVTTTATYSTVTRSFALPVYVGDALYRVNMHQDVSVAGSVFFVDTTRIISLADVGQETATMDLAAGTLFIPSVTVGSVVITDVEFDLIERETLTFKLKSYTRDTE